jgi:hypothetical protein
MLLSLFLTLAISWVQATTFRPQAIEQQIDEADGILQGHYLRSQVIRQANGSLATQMIFKMEREIGLQSDLMGMDEIIVHYPGGSLNGETTTIEGVPTFVAGEKVVLFIKSFDNRYWGMNLGFGSYRMVNYGKDVVLINYLFPQLPKIGQVKLREFDQAVRKIKSSDLKTVKSFSYSPTEVQRAPASLDKENSRQNRSVASSVIQSENKEDQPKYGYFWLLAILGFLGGLYRMGQQKSR